MEGITILEEQIIHYPNLFGVFLFISGFLSMIIGIIVIVNTYYEEIGLIIVLIGVVNLLSGMIVSALPGEPTNKAIYTVKIEEKIDLNEFLSNYEIVEHEKYSNIYKIKGDLIDDNP